MYGRKHTRETLQKMRLVKLGAKNHLWLGDEVGYNALHEWIKARKPKPALCEKCKNRSPFDLASRADKYTRNLNDWEWLCRRCHMLIDKRLEKLQLIPIENKNLERDTNGRFKGRN